MYCMWNIHNNKWNQRGKRTKQNGKKGGKDNILNEWCSTIKVGIYKQNDQQCRRKAEECMVKARFTSEQMV